MCNFGAHMVVYLYFHSLLFCFHIKDLHAEVHIVLTAQTNEPDDRHHLVHHLFYMAIIKTFLQGRPDGPDEGNEGRVL